VVLVKKKKGERLRKIFTYRMKSQEHGIHGRLELSRFLKVKHVLRYESWRIHPWLDWSELVNSLVEAFVGAGSCLFCVS